MPTPSNVISFKPPRRALVVCFNNTGVGARFAVEAIGSSVAPKHFNDVDKALRFAGRVSALTGLQVLDKVTGKMLPMPLASSWDRAATAMSMTAASLVMLTEVAANDPHARAMSRDTTSATIR